MMDTNQLKKCLQLLLFIGCCMQARSAKAMTEKNEIPEELHVYVLMGDALMDAKSRGEGDASQIVARCYILNDQEEWEPARFSAGQGNAKHPGTGIGYGFARAMLKQDKNAAIGLVYCTGPGSKIEDWHRKSDLYRDARKRTKIGRRHGVLKGVLWRHGKSLRLSALDHMKDIIANFRADQSDLNLPFVVGEIPRNPAMNVQLVTLAADVHAIGVANISSEPSGRAEAALGERCAEEMLKIQREWAVRTAQKHHKEIPIIDAHIHGASNKKDGLDVVAKWMEKNNVSHCISHALRPTRPENEQQRQWMRENFSKYEGKILRFCFIEPDEVDSVEAAVEILEKEKAHGAVGFGEHYGRDLMFDDPRNLRLYAACERVGFPVMFHIDSNKNMVERSMYRVARVLEMFPKCNVIAHADWWRYLPDGTCDRMLQKYPNLYADVSGLGMAAVLNRDRGYTREFLIRNADKVLFGTDEGWWSFKDAKSENLAFQLFDELDLPDDVRTKILRGNAERLFGIASEL